MICNVTLNINLWYLKKIAKHIEFYEYPNLILTLIFYFFHIKPLVIEVFSFYIQWVSIKVAMLDIYS